MSETIATPDNCGLQVTGEDREKMLAVLNEYLKDFQAPDIPPGGANFLMGGLRCANCGKTLDGLLGTFSWGMAHGEGACAACGWPCRGCHYIKVPFLEKGEMRLGGPQNPYILQYAAHCLKPESLERLRAKAEVTA